MKYTGWTHPSMKYRNGRLYPTIADAMKFTELLAEHVDKKTEKTASIFTMMRQMMEGQNYRIKTLESKVESLLMNTSPNIADRVERLEERKK